MRRHHRERVIRNRVNLREHLGWEVEKPGKLAKSGNKTWSWWYRHSERSKGNYAVRGVTRYGYWDDPAYFNTRQALKRMLRKEVEDNT